MNFKPISTLTRDSDRRSSDEASRRVFLIGLGCAVATTAIAALQPVAMRFGALNIDPLLFCAGSAIVAAGCVAVMMARNGELTTLVDRSLLPRLFAISLTGTVATSLALIYGFAKINAVAGVILLESEPVYSLLLATIFVRERPSKRQLIATVTILAGIGSVLGAGRAFTPFYAAALVFATPLFWQASHVLSLGVMPPLTPRCITGARYIYAACVLLLILLIANHKALAELSDPRVVLTIGFTGIFIYFLGSLSWYGAISRLSLAWTTAFVIPGVPMLSFVFAVLFLNERPSPREIIGIIVAVTGVIALVAGADARRGQATGEGAEALHQPLT
jgi:drug/metabolite transporter (DMT)-like permease